MTQYLPTEHFQERCACTLQCFAITGYHTPQCAPQRQSGNAQTQRTTHYQHRARYAWQALQQSKVKFDPQISAAEIKTTRSWRMGSEYGPSWPPPREYYLGHFRAPPFLLRRAQSGSLRAPSGPVDARPGEGTARPGIPGLLPETPGKTPGLAPGMDRRPNPE